MRHKRRAFRDLLRRDKPTVMPGGCSPLDARRGAIASPSNVGVRQAE